MDSNMDHDKHPGTSASHLDKKESRAHQIKRKASKSVAEFFGIAGESDDKANQLRWEHRRARIASSIGKGLKDTYQPKGDMVDLAPNIRDPLAITRQMSRQWSRMSAGTAAGSEWGGRPTPGRKKSVLQMTMSGLGNLSHVRKDLRSRKSLKGLQSFPPGSVGPGTEESRAVPADTFSLVDDVFFDEQQPGTSGARAGKELAGGPSAAGWRRKPPQPLPSTPGGDKVDAPEFGFRKIKDKVVQSALKREKRQMGMGILGQFMRRRLDSRVMTKDVKKQMDDLDDHRPYFTYWVTFVQIVVFIVSLAVYGIAPIGVSTKDVKGNVRMPNLAIQTEIHTERENLWIGPRQSDLIHLGAKYSPCMRVDENLKEAIKLDTNQERDSGCCIRNDGSGCVQTIESACSELLSRWVKWSRANPGPKGRSGGPVCGQDPRFCTNPSSTVPFEWDPDITNWEICKETVKPNQSAASTVDQHMTCDLLGKPCCFGIQGECIITTREHCDLKRGYYHDDATLCSQVNCFEEICGMIPFASEDSPDQFYRLWTSLFLHGGLVHLLITILFQFWIMRDLEKLMGAIRIAIIYIGAGVAGNLASCTFIPYQVEAGPSGAQFGVAACLLVEVLQSYQMYKHPFLAVLKLLLPLFCFFLLGLLPWFDNWAHIFGFFFGFLLAFALMPYVSFGHFDRRRKIISIIVCLGGAICLFTILVIVFYVAPLTECDWCIYLNCIPFTADFCENMAVTIKTNSTYALSFTEK